MSKVIRGHPARVLCVALTVMLGVPPALRAQDAGGGTLFRPEELEQIVAPVALYPDPLLAQVLMAATYPLEIVQADRFVKGNPDLKESALDAALRQQIWDDSVKSLTAFPQTLAMMSDKLDWTQKLGDAVLGQQPDVMAAVQRLRAKAQTQGALETTAQQTVAVAPASTTQQTIITIEPASPQVVYVPAYDPATVYGAWPYPAYPPYPAYAPGVALAAGAITFGLGMAAGAALWGDCDWNRGDVNVNVDRYNNFSNNVNVEARRNQIQANRTNVQGNRQTWQHNPQHRQGTQYRDAATQQRFNRTGVPDASAREAFRGRAEQGRQQLGTGGAGTQRASGGAPRSVNRANGTAGAGGAFEGLGQGRNVQAHSARGQGSLGAARASAPGAGNVAASAGSGGGRAGGVSGGARQAGGGARAGGGGRGRR